MRRKLAWRGFWGLVGVASVGGCVPDAVSDGLTGGITAGINEIVLTILTSIVLG